MLFKKQRRGRYTRTNFLSLSLPCEDLVKKKKKKPPASQNTWTQPYWHPDLRLPVLQEINVCFGVTWPVIFCYSSLSWLRRHFCSSFPTPILVMCAPSFNLLKRNILTYKTEMRLLWGKWTSTGERILWTLCNC